MFSAEKRPEQISKLSNYQFDVLVIGGGITWIGIALDAVTRGMSVTLVEMQEFAAGTSSRSMKLVAEVGKECEIVYENAVHETRTQRMLLPFL